MYLSWENDICWCADSIDKCMNTDCFRHLCNKSDEENIFTMSYLMWTEYCPKIKESEEVSK